MSRELGDGWGIAGALNLLGALDRAREDFAAADANFAEALTRFQELGDPGWIALATLNLGTVAYWRRDPDRANALMHEALARYQELDDAYGMAITLSDWAERSPTTEMSPPPSGTFKRVSSNGSALARRKASSTG